MKAVTTRGLFRATTSKWRSASTSTKPPRIRPYKPAAPRKQPCPPTYSVPTDAPKPHHDTLQSLWRRSWLPLSGAALVAGFLGFYVVGTAAASFKQCPCSSSHEHDTPTGRPPALTGDNAERFDKELDLPEWWMGIKKLRRRLAGRAKGDVLELAVGTGRNLQYYNWDGIAPESQGGLGAATIHQRPAGLGLTSFTGLDISVDMLEVARKRLVDTVTPVKASEPIEQKATTTTVAVHAGGRQTSFLNHQLRLIQSDAHRTLPLAMTSDGTAGKPYDTIIQTFGLCSVSDPVAVLCNLASAVKPDTGRILLLEHGRGWSGLVNGLLDKNAGKHFEKYGCWWNRDIEALVDEAVQKTPGLEVVKLHRPNILQVGTLVSVELRMKTKEA